MTPASSARYQSRLFRFVHKQSRRFNQQCDRAWRNLQSTASWVAAVGMYPIFLLLQSRRSTANQVHQAVEATLRQLPSDDAVIQEESPTVDTPIRQVLLYVTGAGRRELRELRELREQERSTVFTQCSVSAYCQLLTNNHQPIQIDSQTRAPLPNILGGWGLFRVFPATNECERLQFCCLQQNLLPRLGRAIALATRRGADKS